MTERRELQLKEYRHQEILQLQQTNDDRYQVLKEVCQVTIYSLKAQKKIAYLNRGDGTFHQCTHFIILSPDSSKIIYQISPRHLGEWSFKKKCFTDDYFFQNNVETASFLTNYCLVLFKATGLQLYDVRTKTFLKCLDNHLRVTNMKVIKGFAFVRQLRNVKQHVIGWNGIQKLDQFKFYLTFAIWALSPNLTCLALASISEHLINIQQRLNNCEFIEATFDCQKVQQVSFTNDSQNLIAICKTCVKIWKNRQWKNPPSVILMGEGLLVENGFGGTVGFVFDSVYIPWGIVLKNELVPTFIQGQESELSLNFIK